MKVLAIIDRRSIMYQVDFEFLRNAKESNLKPAPFIDTQENREVSLRLQEAGFISCEERDGVILVVVTKEGEEALKVPNKC